MAKQFVRAELLFGTDAMNILENSRVLVFGVGGVGGYVCEALARSGVGHFLIVDNDTVAESNINRQIIATYDTIGQSKVIAMKNRILSINPNCDVETKECFYLPETAPSFDFSKFDYVVDCVDTVAAKISIVLEAQKSNVKVISAMGAGNKCNPAELQVSDIYKTSVDPLARVMRYELKKRRVKKLKVVYSTEKPVRPFVDCKSLDTTEKSKKRDIPGSTAFVPTTMGLIIASEIVKDLINFDKIRKERE